MAQLHVFNCSTAVQEVQFRPKLPAPAPNRFRIVPGGQALVWDGDASTCAAIIQQIEVYGALQADLAMDEGPMNGLIYADAIIDIEAVRVAFAQHNTAAKCDEFNNALFLASNIPPRQHTAH